MCSATGENVLGSDVGRRFTQPDRHSRRCKWWTTYSSWLEEWWRLRGQHLSKTAATHDYEGQIHRKGSEKKAFLLGGGWVADTRETMKTLNHTPAPQSDRSFHFLWYQTTFITVGRHKSLLKINISRQVCSGHNDWSAFTNAICSQEVACPTSMLSTCKHWWRA